MSVSFTDSRLLAVLLEALARTEEAPGLAFDGMEAGHHAARAEDVRLDQLPVRASCGDLARSKHSHSRKLPMENRYRTLPPSGFCGTVRSMSKLTTSDPNELRPLLHERIDQCSPEELVAVRKLLLELEARRLFDEVGRGFDEDWASGKLTKENIQEAIVEHRRKHPYR